MTNDGAAILDAGDRDFLQNGYRILNLEDTKTLEEARAALRDTLRTELGRPDAELEEYHTYPLTGERHDQLVASLTEVLRGQSYPRRILEANRDFFLRFIGPDLCVQRAPYLRVARPHCPEDNVDYHRDTHYGRSPFELSVWIPFSGITPEMALRILPGSHVAPESDYPTEQRVRENVQPGSLKHRLGVPYAPKQMSPDIEARMQPIPVEFGQALIFSLSVVHGQRVNLGTRTRMTCDVRVVHALAPIRWTSTACEHYYEPLSISAVSEQAHRYAVANQLESPLRALVGS